MPREEQGTYFLYGRGYQPGELRLGHLVLEKYENPRASQSQPFALPDGVNVRDVANITEYNGKLSVIQKRKIGLDLLVLGGGQMGPQYATENTRIVSAEKGNRIELKDSTDFLRRVLADDKVRTSLRSWTSVSRSKYLRARTGISRAPEIWVLTGLLELENANISVVKSRDKGFKVAIDPGLMTQLCGAGIGFAIDLGHSRSVEVETTVRGKMVWAGRFQLLQTIYKTWEGNRALSDNQFQLHPDDIFAGDLVLGDDDDDDEGQENVEDGEQIAELTLLPVRSSRSDAGELGVEYWEAYEEAERRMISDDSGANVV